MEFRLEDFDNQQEPSIDLEGKSVEENSFGEKEKKFREFSRSIPIDHDNFIITEEKEIKRQLRKSDYALWGIVWRALVCCAVIDLLLIGYFRFFKNLGPIEGLSQWQKTVTAMMRKNEPEQEKTVAVQVTPKPTPIRPKRTQAVKHHLEEQTARKVRQVEAKPKQYVLYSWREESGYRGYSNVGFPKDKPYSDPRVEFH